MPGTYDQRWSRLAAIGALVAALGLSACGRKSGLDPPPAAAVAPVQEPVVVQQQYGTPDVLPPSLAGPLPAEAAVGQPAAAPPPPRGRQPFILDWLVN